MKGQTKLFSLNIGYVYYQRRRIRLVSLIVVWNIFPQKTPAFMHKADVIWVQFKLCCIRVCESVTRFVPWFNRSGRQEPLFLFQDSQNDHFLNYTRPQSRLKTIPRDPINQRPLSCLRRNSRLRMVNTTYTILQGECTWAPPAFQRKLLIFNFS